MVFDVDDVVADLNFKISGLFRQLNIDEKDWVDGIFNILHQPVLAKHKDFFKNTFHDPNFYIDMPLEPGALEGVNRLARDHKIIFCTKRWPHLRDITEYWLIHQGFTFHGLYCGTNKDIVIPTIQADAFVDDFWGEHEALRNYAHGNPGFISIINNKPWNEYKNESYVWRAYGWQNSSGAPTISDILEEYLN